VTKERKNEPRNSCARRARGTADRRIGQEGQSFTRVLFTGPGEDTLENGLRLRMLETVLDILMREELREQRSGVCTSSVWASMKPEPDGLYEISFSFGSDPERAQKL